MASLPMSAAPTISSCPRATTSPRSRSKACPLAFDRTGARLGQGGGHYDRTIAGLRARGPVLVIGVAYAGQEVGEIPTELHDERLDGILTETGYIAVR